MSRAFIQKRLPFKPTDIGGCQLWLDGADSTSASMILSGSTVSTWKDKSSNAYNFTQSSYSTSLPPLSNLANQRGVYFGSLQALYNTTYTFPTTYTIFSVANQLTRNSYQYILHSPYNADHIIFFGSLSGNFATFAGPAPSWNDVNANSPTSVIATTSNTASLLCCTNDGTTLIPYFNAVSLNTKVGTNATATGMTIGDTDTADARQPWLGTIGEIIIYTSILSDTNRRQVESYLAQKWGLQTSLPQGHPGTRGIVYPASPLNVMFRVPYQTGFIPTSISSCQLWLDASDITTITLSGSSVTQWKDKSVTMASAIQNNSLGYPTYVSGSTPYVLFSPNQALRIASWNYSSSWTVILAMNSVTLAARWFISPYNNLGLVYMGMSEPGNKIFSGLLAGSGDVTGNHLESTMAQNTSTTGVFNYYRDAQIQSTNTTNAGIASVNGIALGIGANQSGDYDIGGTYQIYELLIFSSFLGDSDRFNVEGYLAWKWGMQANLPAGHPYKNAAPNVSNQFGISRPQNLPVPPITIYAGPRPPTYVTSGLLFYLDAGNATSYPGSGSTWTDLAGSGLTTTLYNSPTYSSANGGYLAFAPGSSQYGQTSASLATLSSWSLEVWHYYTATNTGSLPCIITEVWSSTPINFTLGSGSGSTSSLQVGYFNNGWFTTTGSYSLPSVGWYHIVGTYDGANLKLYVNNVLTQTSASTTASVSSALGIRFMRRWDNPEYWGGYLAIIRIYNRALSATEVTTNYAASKARFGLS